MLLICPASLRKQWALELEEKFNLSAVVPDSKTWREAQREQLIDQLTQRMTQQVQTEHLLTVSRQVV